MMALLFKSMNTSSLIYLAFIIALGQSPALALNQPADRYGYSNQNRDQFQHHADETGHWIVDPGNPGAVIPDDGRSLFDMIVTTQTQEGSSIEVPYPFEKLIEKIAGRMKLSDDAIKRVRIPIGRSLRREITAPDYFHSPRIIIATDSDPRLTPQHGGINLKGRLFLGYQQTSNLLEIISYNPWAGRFEFQEVHDYGPGMVPELKYSNRTLCLSCHQNAGPIFPKEPWLETDSNQQIRMRLPGQPSTSKIKAEYLPRFDNVWGLDYATDRANYFASSQFIWQHACGADNRSEKLKAIQCRAAMLKAVLQYHLLDYVDQHSSGFREWFLPMVIKNWQKKWPGGLLIATADIDDRNPFSVSKTASQDPLNPRPPRAKWLKPSTHLLTGIIYQTADFITETDIIQIDRFLRQQAIVKNIPVKRYRSTCRLNRTADIGIQQHIAFSCEQGNIAAEPVFSAIGVFIVAQNRIIDGNINTLELPEVSENIRFLDLADTPIIQDGNVLRARIPVNKYKSQIGARLFNGTLIRELEFEWPATLKAFSSVNNQTASLITVDDLDPLYSAIDKMTLDTQNGHGDALSAKPIRRHALLKSLHRQLGMPALKWQHDQPSTPITVEQKRPVSQHPTAIAPFFRHCASCHMNEGKFPPGFLAGNPAQIKQKLSQCAQKILTRLSLWNINPQNRFISPMPPSSWLSISGLSENDWRNSNDLNQMRQIAIQLASNNTSRNAQPAQTSNICSED